MNNEDIKVLEKLQKVFAELRKDDEEGHASSYELQWEDIQAIENLIKGYKELEEKNEEYKADNKYLDERVQFLEARRKDIINKFQNEITDTTIPKSKIQELIKEKEKNIKELQNKLKGRYGKSYILTLKCETALLQELLQEGDDK